MALTRADARRWLSGFDAAERADREARAREGPRPAWSIALSLSLLETARRAAAAQGRSLADPRRAAQDEAVRQVWDRLRARLLP